MLTFLFWNVGGELPAKTEASRVAARNVLLLEILGNLARIHEVDILILAECPLPPADVLQRINAGNPTPYHHTTSNCERLALFTRFPRRFISLSGARESTHYAARPVCLPGRTSFLLVAAHLASKRNRSDESQAMAMPELSWAIRAAETKAAHDRTILVGDLNMNPFETGMVDAHGLNAVMTRDVASQRSRTVDTKEYLFFYNPMWSCFGDSSHEVCPPGHQDHEPAGTCYYSAGESRWYYWNILDQVLVRPSLLSAFRNRDLKILTTDGTTSFLTDRGLPASERLSDHLPLLFRLDI